MILSMTGFGRGEATSDACRVQVDVRTVNHRYLDLQVRLPRQLTPLEMEIRDWVKKGFNRGRVEVSVQFERLVHDAGGIRVDEGLAAGYQQALAKLSERLELPSGDAFALIVRQPGVLETGEQENDFDAVRPVLREAFDNATAAALQMKTTEGEALVADLRASLAALRVVREELVEVVPQIQQEVAARFREKVAEWSGENGIDESRLHQEVALLLGKLDVNEELVRLVGHLDHAEQMLGADEPVGRRLDFLSQEMHREMTTLGNKVHGLPVARRVLDGKAEIEKFREQVQNVE